MAESKTGSQQGGSWEESLKFDEVAKFFSVPIAEAAGVLGVCSSVLKKICRDNGVLRWPYRKFLAGKTVEEIKKDAARERTKELAELAKAARQRMDASTTISSTSVAPSTSATQLPNRTTSSIQDTLKLKLGGSGPSHSSPQLGNKILQNGRHHMHHPVQARSIPTYLDEFKYGFPSNGLSSVSARWWGTCDDPSSTDKTLEEESAPNEAAKQPGVSSNDTADRAMTVVNVGQTSAKLDRVERFYVGSDGAVLLSTMRKRNADDGRAALKLGVTRGYGAYRLGRRERMLLVRVFGKSALPSQWRCNFS